MKRSLLIFFILVLSTTCLDALAQVKACDEVFEYNLVEESSLDFSIVLSSDIKGSYVFKLYSILEGEKFVDEIDMRKLSSGAEIIFEGLNKDEVYLIQAISTETDCRSTIGGMKGIQFLNE